MGNSKKVLEFTEKVCELLESGFEFTKSLEIMTRSKNGKGDVKKAAHEILCGLSRGERLSLVIRKVQSLKFPDFFVVLVETGEKSGNMKSVFERLCLDLKRQNEFTEKVKLILAYPLVLVCLCLVCGILLVFFGPLLFQGMTEDFNAELYRIESLKTLGECNLLLFAGICFFLLLIKNNFEGFCECRFWTGVGFLFESGIGFYDCLESCWGLVKGNRKISSAVAQALDRLDKGNSLSSSLRGFEENVVLLFETAENTGNMKKAIDKIKEVVEKKNLKREKKISILIEPLSMVLVGMYLGILAIKLLGPYMFNYSFDL